jgi:hypothetical protein
VGKSRVWKLAVVGGGLATIGALSLSFVANASADTASSDSESIGARVFKVCAEGNYSAYLSFPERGGFSTFVAIPGKCADVSLPAVGQESFVVWGIDPAGMAKQLMGVPHPDNVPVTTVHAGGTTEAPELSVEINRPV